MKLRSSPRLKVVDDQDETIPSHFKKSPLKSTKSGEKSPSKSVKKVKPVTTTKEKAKNFVRNKTDFIWMAGFLSIFYVASERTWARSNTSDLAYIATACNPLQLKSELVIWSVWLAVTIVALFGMTAALWFMMRALNREATPDTHFHDQGKAILVNFVLLGVMQTGWDYLTSRYAFHKIRAGHLAPLDILVDSLLWIVAFEWAWYTQHRLMHDVKFLWSFGHAYHHTWRKPDHMIGITNFAFDHVVEIWVTMSSSFLGYVLFPANYYVGKGISLAYMVLAVLVHWDGFGLSRYHINHHYLVTKNYGSHVPVFDMFFGTYQWENYEHPLSMRSQKKE